MDFCVVLVMGVSWVVVDVFWVAVAAASQDGEPLLEVLGEAHTVS